MGIWQTLVIVLLFLLSAFFLLSFGTLRHDCNLKQIIIHAFYLKVPKKLHFFQEVSKLHKIWLLILNEATSNLVIANNTRAILSWNIFLPIHRNSMLLRV